MRVVDSSAWIEWFRRTAHGSLLAPHWPSRDKTIVPTLVQYELARWAKREVSGDLASKLIAYTETCRVEPLDTRIALKAAELSRLHRLAMADAVIYATALERNADCLTCDSHFEGLAQVVLIAKVGRDN